MIQKSPYLPVALVLFSIGCSPLVVTQTKAPGITLHADLLKNTYGADKIVKLKIEPQPQNTNLEVEFIGPSPENLSIEKESGHIIMKWKIGEDHIKSFHIRPYEIKLSTESKEYKATISFKTTSEQLINAVFWTLIPIR